MTLQVLAMLGTSTNVKVGIKAPSFDGSQPCAQVDPEIFFAEVADRETIRQAVGVCRSCSFTTPCLEYALQEPLAGIWGGTTEVERKRLRRKVR